LESNIEYKVKYESFNKLFEGYPVNSFDDYLKKLNFINSCIGNHHIPTTSSTTSNTNPNTTNLYKEDSNIDLFNENSGQIEIVKSSLKNLKKK
jgi:hypothetical protein